MHAVQSPATELADLRTAMVVMQSSAADELREERQKHLDEVANLHRLLQGTGIHHALLNRNPSCEEGHCVAAIVKMKPTF